MMRVQTAEQREADRMRKAAGFSLIELLLVVAVILIIAAIAIPNYIHSKERANEAGAVQNLRTITTAETVYTTTYSIGYSTSLAQLGGTTLSVDQNNAGLIDSVLATGTKAGYSFTYSVVATDQNGDVTSFTINADPVIPGQSGDQHYYTDQSNIITHNVTQVASASDPSI
jgi:prepilin-type N-terminal cleavage/methylation domain-containing protein